MGNCNREIRVRGKHPLTDVDAKILLYYCIFLRNLRIFKSVNRNYFHTLPDGRKGITWPLMAGDSGYRSQYLLHAKRALYHLRLFPLAEEHIYIVCNNDKLKNRLNGRLKQLMSSMAWVKSCYSEN